MAKGVGLIGVSKASFLVNLNAQTRFLRNGDIAVLVVQVFVADFFLATKPALWRSVGRVCPDVSPER